MKKNFNLPNVIIFSRWPIMGFVKNRLAKTIGLIKATQFARSSLNFTIKKLKYDKRWTILVAITPNNITNIKIKPKNTSFFIPQGKGNLGERMWTINNSILRPVIIIGSDIPAVSKLHIIKAIKLLKSNDVVIGPSSDGGYWLIGFSKRKNISYPFNNVRWSTSSALEDTCRNFKKLNIKIGFCDELTDVDDKNTFVKNNKTYASFSLGINSTKLQGRNL